MGKSSNLPPTKESRAPPVTLEDFTKLRLTVVEVQAYEIHLERVNNMVAVSCVEGAILLVGEHGINEGRCAQSEIR